MREDPSRPFREEGRVVGAVGEQRSRERPGLSVVLHFVAGTPGRTPRVERIQNEVAALGVVELRCVFERRIVHDRRLAAGLDLD